MRKGFKILIVVLIVVTIGMIFVPALITGFTGGHP